MTSFSLPTANAVERNLAWRIHDRWKDCITFDSVDKTTFEDLVAGIACDPFYVTRFVHHALAKAATRKGQSMARRQIIAPLAELAEMLEPYIKPRNGVVKVTTADVGTLDGIALSTTAMTPDIAEQVLNDVKILQAQAEFIKAMLSMAQTQRLADFHAGVAAATR